MGEQLVKHLWFIIYIYIIIYNIYIYIIFMVIWSYICLSMICSEVPIISDELHLKRGIWSTTPLADPRLANASEVFETATGCDFHQWRPGWIAKSMAKSRKTEKFSRDEHCKTARPDDFPRDARDFSCDSFKGNPVGPVKSISRVTFRSKKTGTWSVSHQ